MALGTPISLGVAEGSTSAALASATPASGDRIYAIVAARDTVACAKGTVSDTQSLTWTEVADFSGTDPGAANRWLRITVYSAIANGSATVITGSSAGAQKTTVEALTYSGAGSPSANVAGNESATGDPSVNLSTPAAGSGVFGAHIAHGTGNLDVPSGYAEIIAQDYASPNTKVQVVWDNTSPSSTLTWSTNNTPALAIAVEVPEAGGVTPVPVQLTSVVGDGAGEGIVAAVLLGFAPISVPGDATSDGPAVVFALGHVLVSVTGDGTGAGVAPGAGIGFQVGGVTGDGSGEGFAGAFAAGLGFAGVVGDGTGDGPAPTLARGHIFAAVTGDALGDSLPHSVTIGGGVVEESVVGDGTGEGLAPAFIIGHVWQGLVGDGEGEGLVHTFSTGGGGGTSTGVRNKISLGVGLCT